MRKRPAVGLAALAMATCRLELMGLPDTQGYRRLAQGVLRQGACMFSGLNVPNKKPGEPLLEWAKVVREEFPDGDLCVHYSLKHQRGGGNPAAAFERFCCEAAELGVARVLLVTGPRGPAFDTVAVLERLCGQHSALGRLKIGVAFNACLPTESEREAERGRLQRKLRTRLVSDVWLNCGSDPALLGAGAAFARGAAAEPGLPPVEVFGSVLLPNEAQLWQMREHPWGGVHFSEEYLESLEGMGRVTGEVLAEYRAGGVEPIVESKVRNSADLKKLADLLSGSVRANAAAAVTASLAQATPRPLQPPAAASRLPMERQQAAAKPQRRWVRQRTGCQASIKPLAARG